MGTQGFSDDLAEKLDLGHRSGLLHGLHGLRVVRRGELVLERYFTAEDESWGRPLGRVKHGPDMLHDLRSVTKSVTSLLYGIALERGQVPPPDAALLESFPDYAALAEDPKRAGWTVGHALNMTLGTEWNEELPYTDPANSEIMMERAADRYRFILDRPIVHEPGSRWIYNGGATALIGHLIERGTGQPLDAFAREALFAPLGIVQSEWLRGSDGVPSPASGLRLTLPGLARIGEMVLAGGRWQGRPVVPAAWLALCRTPQVSTGFLQYSHFWYLSDMPVPATGATSPMISAMGNGGQRLYVLPELDLVIAVFCGNYNAFDQWMTPTLVLQRLVLANLEGV